MKKSFIVYDDTLLELETLTDEEIGKIFRNIARFRAGKETELSGALLVIFNIFKNQIIRDEEKYNRIVEKRKEAGKKGGQANAKQMKASANKSKQMLSSAKQTQANEAVTDTVNDTDTVTVKKKKIIYPPEFEKFWAIYPRKLGKKKSYEMFKKNVNGNLEDLLIAVENYKNSNEERYLKYPERFLKDGFWEDWIDGNNDFYDSDNIFKMD